ncbi:DNA-binding transcriptional MerR regulator [Breznakia sp. PF5-3]|uniref:MerR family transcriptional regulator n=1 Tax=unclassified Breznakia TaxID=2623764 RepID=UPI00240737AC|nr:MULTISPECIES: MerR family transcriptional regulator [unclassified Breznakia]MDF9824718.1 DNA-binding transcriptional MerR regulator [Breznakia sp. PM6-1]MDF9835381.1 DNA-binding transcriptional MerR regulator [Breznakia sp. PF5-3]MDF9836980.1 DNA-binding transcriptional MerR regulator [Breznakia sp. PFB2-8]MDF9859616.1 DNA-binding transcriptional MerR regulator [Breznakia sp. PH5-24]
MNNLVKIRDVSNKYNITARTLRYYEDMGLLHSIRNDDVAYRMYDEKAVRRIEQILILRKLNISIKDIQRIFNADGSDVVLEVLGKKVDTIDGEVSLLHELKDIVLDFIKEIENMSFTDNADIKQLYDKAKAIETQFVSADYIGKPSNVNRLIEISEQLDKKIPDVMVVRVPSFKAITSGDQTWMDIFKEGGYMFQLWQYYHLFKPVIFDCLDFTLPKNDKAEMICALKEDVIEADVPPFQMIDFPGGLYAMAVSIDEDDESIQKVQDKIYRWIDNTNFEVDNTRDYMFNMPYLDEDNIYNKDIEKGLGYKQMQRYVPIKLKDENK